MANIQDSKTSWIKIRTALGLDIGSASIKIVELKKTGSGLTLNNLFFTEIPSSLKENQLKRDRFIVDTIKRAKQENKVSASSVCVALSGPEVNIVSLNIPKVPLRDLKSTVIYEAKKQVQFDQHKVHMRFQFCREMVASTGLRFVIVAAIAQKETISKKIDMLRELGLTPLGISILPNALGNCLRSIGPINHDEVIAVLDLGAATTTLGLYKGEMLEFSREIPIGGDTITQSLTRQVVLSDRTIILGPEEAEALKKECGIPMKAELEEKIGILPKSEVMNLMRPVLERMSMEVLRSINFYRQASKVEAVDRVLLCGGGSRLRNISAYLNTTLRGIKVDVLDLSKCVQGFNIEQKAFLDISSILAVAFGLAQGIKKKEIDLMPFSVKLSVYLQKARRVIRIVLPTILGVIIMFCIIYGLQIPYYKQLIRRSQVNLTIFREKLAMIDEFDAKLTQFTELQRIIGQLKAKLPPWPGILKELGAITPEWVNLNRITIVKDSQPVRLRIEGEISDVYTTIDLGLSQYLLALDESVFFDNVNLVSKTQDTYSPSPKAIFETICQLVY